MESNLRSFVKSMSWRLGAVTNGMLVAAIVTGDWKLGMTIGAIGNLTGMVFYFVHERIWNVVKWGRK